MRATLVIVVVCLFTSHAHAVTVAVDAQNKPTAVNGLVVGTSVFDASFAYDFTFDGLYGSDPIPASLPFQTEAEADAFSQALMSVLNSMNIIPDDIPGLSAKILLPVPEMIDNPAFGEGKSIFFDRRRGGSWRDFGNSRFPRDEIFPRVGFTEITLVGTVPEPHTFLFATLAGGTLLWRRRRSA